MSPTQPPEQNQTFGTDVSPEELDAILAANEAERNARAADKATAKSAGQPESGAAELSAQLAELQAKNAELADLYLRAQADVQNARRRADEDMAKARKFAVEGFADSLLPALDSLEAGLAHVDATPVQIREGAEATLRQLKSALERNKVIEINPAAGAKFDPHQHQAISVVPAAEGSSQDPNTIVAVLQKGYTIAERVLRPALVTVSAPK
jgi:molecular chaperone GrpE